MFTCMDGVVDNTRQVNSARKVLRLAYKHVLDEVGEERGVRVMSRFFIPPSDGSGCSVMVNAMMLTLLVAAPAACGCLSLSTPLSLVLGCIHTTVFYTVLYPHFCIRGDHSHRICLTVLGQS